MYQALYRQFRPLRFDAVYGQEHITRVLQQQVMRGLTGHAYLFTGTRGTGKTTCAKILARAINCEHPENGNPCNECAACRSVLSGDALDVTEMDAASNNGVDDIRGVLAEAAFSPIALKKRVYIIDEVHMLSPGAFNALLKTLEEPPEHVVFILATTELHKVPATILSRCQRFDFRRVDPDVLARNLRYVSDAAGISVTDGALALLARLGDGSVRDAQSLLERCRGVEGTLDEEAAAKLLGISGPEAAYKLTDALIRGDVGSALRYLDTLARDGRDMRGVLSELTGFLRDLLIWQCTGDASLLRSGASPDRLASLARSVSVSRTSRMISQVQDAAVQIQRSSSGRTEAELALIRAASAEASGDSAAAGAAAVPDSLLQRVAALEHAMAGGVPARAAAGEPDAPSPDEAPPFAMPEDAPKNAPKAASEPPEKEKRPERPDPALQDTLPAELAEKLKRGVAAQIGPMRSAFFDTIPMYWDGQVLSLVADFTTRNVLDAATMAKIQKIAQSILGEQTRLKLCDAPPERNSEEKFRGFDSIMGNMDEYTKSARDGTTI